MLFSHAIFIIRAWAYWSTIGHIGGTHISVWYPVWIWSWYLTAGEKFVHVGL